MKVYYISGRYDGCYYVRCYLPLYHNVWDGDKTSLYTQRVSPQQMFQGAMASDIIVFHRPDQIEKINVIPLLQQAGKKVVIDNDDTYRPSSGVPVAMLQDHKKKLLDNLNEYLINAVKMADMVTVSTNTLAEEYSEYNDNVVVLPNCVDPADWGQPIRDTNGPIRVGLVGSVTNTRDYEVIKPLLKELSENPKYQLVVFGLPPEEDKFKLMNEIYAEEIAFWKSLDIEWTPFVDMEDYFETLRRLRLDMALIPREENYFNKCKSNLKFLEMSMLEVPCIASGWKGNPYEKDKKYLYLPKTPQGWRQAIKKLSDGKTRRDRGAGAKMYVLSKYNIKKNHKMWKEAYSKLLNK